MSQSCLTVTLRVPASLKRRWICRIRFGSGINGRWGRIGGIEEHRPVGRDIIPPDFEMFPIRLEISWTLESLKLSGGCHAPLVKKGTDLYVILYYYMPYSFLCFGASFRRNMHLSLYDSLEKITTIQQFLSHGTAFSYCRDKMARATVASRRLRLNDRV